MIYYAKNNINKTLKLLIWIILSGPCSFNVLANDISEIEKILGNTKISLVAPASGACANNLLQLKNSKLNLKLESECFNSSSPFHSADDDSRFQCIKKAIYDENTEIMWSLRGGYGSAKLIEKLDKLPKPKKQKTFIGYSDITALHLFFSQKWGWKTIHGPVLNELVADNTKISNFLKVSNLITDKTEEATIDNLIPLNNFAKNSNKVTGSLTGGNLTIVTTSIGTIWEIQTNNKILFLEDVGAKAYQIDRSLYHLKQAKMLENVKAIIFGNLGQEDELTMRVLREFTNKMKIPAFKTNQFGHNNLNFPIIYNSESSIEFIKQKEKFYLRMKW